MTQRGRPGTGERGMVTAELAVAILAAFSVFVLLCWGLALVVLQLRCIDTAAAVARQEARGGWAGVRLARQQAPDGARVAVDRRRGRVVVTVSLTVRPLRRGLAAVPLRAAAAVVPEPSVHGAR